MVKRRPPTKEYVKKSYQRNRQWYLDHQKERRERWRAYLIAAKDKPCADCAKKYPYYVMDFDHREGVEKVRTVGQMVARQVPVSILQAEIDKCDLVCSNCHRERSHQRFHLNGNGGRKCHPST